MTKVLVFGTFDGVHDGHREMLRQAKKLGNYLVAVVAADASVTELKGRAAKHPLKIRIQNLKNEHLVDEVIAGDQVLGDWSAIKKYKPDIIALGYDQHELKQALLEHFADSQKSPTIITLQAHKPEQYKSSLLNS